MKDLRVAVVGAGAFGRNHMRVVARSEGARLVGVMDADAARAAEAAAEYECGVFGGLEELAGKVDAAIVAVPTVAHAEVGCGLMEAGIDVLVEKPIAASMDEARRLCETAERCGRVLQVGHLERFNPAVAALRELVTIPLFFEIHRLSVFTPRSLDVDVVLDLMIHDLDIVLSLVKKTPEEIRAAGISILSEKVDIANVRLQFPGGCIANLTASRVSVEKVRKLRLFQPSEYLSVDYTRQDGAVVRVGEGRKIQFRPLAVQKDEPLRLEVESFFDAVQERKRPMVSGEDATLALEVAFNILVKIEEHARIVTQTISNP
ncbi:MAG: Gfo/Idh/MocA family oxidoreductase [Bryobacteraceae bacterium]|nr:Gfo/Idh/MocA family oxidoreductase [Bryobacteraceae bacterium]